MTILNYLDKYTFGFLWLFIGLVSAYDAYWLVKLREVIVENELNPIGRFLIYIDNGDVSLFLGLKFGGTILVLGFLLITYFFKKWLAWCLIVPLSIAQLLLLVYLETGFVF